MKSRIVAVLLGLLLATANARAQKRPFTATWSRSSLIVNASMTAAVLAQTWSATSSQAMWNSRRVMTVCGQPPCPFPRPSVLALPWQRTGAGLAYASAATTVLFVGWGAEQMKNSKHNWVRKTWWVPPLAVIAGSIYGTQYNVLHRRVPPEPVFSVRF